MSSWTRWQRFTLSTVAESPKYAGVYEIAAADGRRIKYADGTSHTVYYGKADHSINNRLTRHINGRGSKVLYKLYESGLELKVRWREVVWPDEPEEVECELFTAHEDKFGERPVANIHGCRLSTVVKRLK